MVFSSAVFIFIFLPVLYVLYNAVRGIKAKNYILISASLVFYSFGRLDWLIILVFSAFCNYIAGLFAVKRGKAGKAALICAVVLNIGILCVFKYMNFITEILSFLPFVERTSIDLPIGISFFTFQGMSYVIDSYKNPSCGTKSFGKILLYISLFPQLVAGPIVKYGDISDQIDSRECTPSLTASGIERFITGLAKKLLLANTLGRTADSVYALSVSQLDAPVAWLGVICYTLQIYFDFSGYSDMAIGLGRMFGFRINENFNYPYCAGSVKDFWRRWHISLSTWFRDYLYIPLGGNRHGKARARFNRITVFFFTGLWHGANWTFIVWGLWHGFALMAEDKIIGSGRKTGVIGHIYTLLVAVTGFALFRSSSLAQAWAMLCAMFTVFNGLGTEFFNLLSPMTLAALAAGIICSMPVGRAVSRRKENIPYALRSAALIALFLLCVINLASTSFNPFIYTQF